MLRSIWNGTLKFGTIAMPVGIASARVDKEIEFRTLHKRCWTTVSQRTWCPKHEVVLEGSDTVRGFEIAPGQFVTVSEAELAELAPEGDRTITVTAFLEAGRIEAAQVEKTYFLTTSEGPVGQRPYALLCQVLRELDKLALCRLVFRGHEWLAVVRPHESRRILLLQRIAFSEELVDPTPLERQLACIELEPEEIRLGSELVFAKSPARMRSSLFASVQRPRVRDLIERKLTAGRTVGGKRGRKASAPPAPDLSEALERSLRPRARSGATR